MPQQMQGAPPQASQQLTPTQIEANEAEMARAQAIMQMQQEQQQQQQQQVQ